MGCVESKERNARNEGDGSDSNITCTTSSNMNMITAIGRSERIQRAPSSSAIRTTATMKQTQKQKQDDAHFVSSSKKGGTSTAGKSSKSKSSKSKSSKKKKKKSHTARTNNNNNNNNNSSTRSRSHIDPLDVSEKDLKDSVRERRTANIPPPALDEKGNLTLSEVVMRREKTKNTNDVPITVTATPATATSSSSSFAARRKNFVMDVAACSQRGYYPDDPHKPNQDAYGIHLSNFNNNNNNNNNGDAFLAIYDGHGPVGEHFAKYAKKHIPTLIEKYVRQERVRKHKERNANLPPSVKKIPFNPKLWPLLQPKEYQDACRKAHVECNKNMIDTQPLVNLSGTTAISVAFHNNHMIISNVGDSRAILGYRDQMAKKANKDHEEEDHANGNGNGTTTNHTTNKNGSVVAVPLSRDQTPWRKDERNRIMEAGGRVMTIDQMKAGQNTDDDGNVTMKRTTTTSSTTTTTTSMDDNFGDRNLGEAGDIDEDGDPPRVWLMNKNIPGVSFTRSLGDSVADRVGVYGEPETFTKRITEEDEILVLASDGVFEFVTNQDIIDMCVDSDTPSEACNKVVDAAYHQWLKYEDRTDDITIIVMFLKQSSMNNDDSDDDDDYVGERTVDC